jgi:N-acetylglucosaminyldiphosphoundecaprenol N-acetyl-beta-D-mannosaminyltransferase
MKIDIAGVLIDNITKAEAIAKIDSFVQSGQPHYAVTPYSEIVVFALKDEKYRHTLNSADLSLADGIGVIFAAKYFGTEIRERITGRILVYDIAKLCESKNYSMALVGGTDSVAAQAAYELKKLYPKLTINLALSGFPAFDDRIVKEIAESNSDILLIAYSPPKQEQWLADNIHRLNVKMGIGLGGTFDYIAGKRPVPPQIFHSLGLEWLWRLITQPWRIKRIWNGVPVFAWKILNYKKHERSTS